MKLKLIFLLSILFCFKANSAEFEIPIRDDEESERITVIFYFIPEKFDKCNSDCRKLGTLTSNHTKKFINQTTNTRLRNKDILKGNLHKILKNDKAVGDKWPSASSIELRDGNLLLIDEQEIDLKNYPEIFVLIAKKCK